MPLVIDTGLHLLVDQNTLFKRKYPVQFLGGRVPLWEHHQNALVNGVIVALFVLAISVQWAHNVVLASRCDNHLLLRPVVAQNWLNLVIV